MKLTIQSPRGRQPMLDPRQLDERHGQVARNLYMRHGTLAPIRSLQDQGIGVVDGVASCESIYRYPYGNDGNGFWLVWGNRKTVNVVKSPLADDQYGRIYWTGDGAPKMGAIDMVTAGDPPYPGDSYPLGVTAPDKAPSVAAPSDRDINDTPDTTIDTVYLLTYVTKYGEESGISPASSIVQRWDMVDDAPAGGSVNLSGIPVPSDARITTVRVYRSESGGSYQRVADLDAGVTSWTDSVTSDALGGACESTEWQAPDPNMRGLCALGNGMLAGYYDNTLAFCEAYYPHAWPSDYELAFPDRIVGIMPCEVGLVVATDGRPWLVTGSSPAAMAPSLQPIDQPCLSGRSMVSMGSYVLYASAEGLVAVGGGRPELATDGLISPEQWQDYNPAGIKAVLHEGRYLAVSGSDWDYNARCFAFTPGESFEDYDLGGNTLYRDYPSGQVYLVVDNRDGTKYIGAWDSGDPMTWRFRSKVWTLPPGQGVFTCGRVIAKSYPVTLRIYADGATVREFDVTDRQVFRLPSGFAWSSDWEIEAEGSVEVNLIEIAGSPSELT